MQKFKIEIEEILQEVYEIEASTLEEAIDIAEEKYRNEEIILPPESIKETNFRQFPEELNKESRKNKDRVR